MGSVSDWQDICVATQDALKSKIPLEWQLEPDLVSNLPRNVIPIFASAGILSPREIEITTSQDATTILERIRQRAWSAEEVTRAFCKRAAMAHQLVRCLMDVDFEGAIQQARNLDAYQAESGQVVGPLHGLPISLKDLTCAKGLKYSMGLVMWADKVADSDAPVVSVLRKAGAIVYVKTTMPQTGMAIETVSNLWGRTLNPANTLLTPGGSSGGEGALIGCFGSPVGIGTDVGGSIRVPASFNGLYAIKPTSKRGTYQGNMNNSTAGSPVWSAMGPIGRSVRDLELICRILCQGQPWLTDPRVTYKPWCTVITPKRVTIGVMWWDEVVMPHPPVKRALQMTVDALRAAGHEMVDMAPYKHGTAQDIAGRLSFPTGGKEIKQSLGRTGEPWTKAVKRCLVDAKPRDLAQFLSDIKQREIYQAEYLAHWNSTASLTSTGLPVDAILTPSHASASFPHDEPYYLNYSKQWNLLDYPATIIPVTTANKVVDLLDSSYRPIGELDHQTYMSYNPDLYDGAPVSIQLVGRPLAEEELLAVTEAVDQALHPK